MIDIDRNSAKIAVDTKGSAPGIDVRPSRQTAVFHLTRNAKQIIANDKSATDSTTSAIMITGSVNVRCEKERNLEGWKFNFVQLAKLREYSTGHAGRTSRDGSIEMNFWVPPLIPDDYYLSYCLDSFKETLPFFNFDEHLAVTTPQFDMLHVTNSVDDHPNRPVFLKLPNIKTKVDNFAYRADLDIEFLTAFVAVDPTYAPGKPGLIKILAHVEWRATWSARFQWQKGTCIPTLVSKRLVVGQPVKGAPDDALLSDTISNPPTSLDETANVIGQKAQEKISKGTTFNLNLRDRWPADVPVNFYKD